MVDQILPESGLVAAEGNSTLPEAAVASVFAGAGFFEGFLDPAGSRRVGPPANFWVEAREVAIRLDRAFLKLKLDSSKHFRLRLTTDSMSARGIGTGLFLSRACMH